MNLEAKISMLNNFHKYLNKHHADKPSKLELHINGHLDDSHLDRANSCNGIIKIYGVEKTPINDLLWTLAHEHHHSQHTIFTISGSNDFFLGQMIISILTFLITWSVGVPLIWMGILFTGMFIRFSWSANKSNRIRSLKGETNADHFANTVIGGGADSFYHLLIPAPRDLIVWILGCPTHPFNFSRYIRANQYPLNKELYNKIYLMENTSVNESFKNRFFNFEKDNYD